MFFTFKLNEDNSAIDYSKNTLQIQYKKGKILCGFNDYFIGEICENDLLKNTNAGSILKKEFDGKTCYIKETSKVYKQNGDYIVLFVETMNDFKYYEENIDSLNFLDCNYNYSLNAIAYKIDENIKDLNDFFNKNFYNHFYDMKLNFIEYKFENLKNFMKDNNIKIESKYQVSTSLFSKTYINSNEIINSFDLSSFINHSEDNNISKFVYHYNFSEFISKCIFCLTKNYCIMITINQNF